MGDLGSSSSLQEIMLKKRIAKTKVVEALM
jgi:hypothetical protein